MLIQYLKPKDYFGFVIKQKMQNMKKFKEPSLKEFIMDIEVILKDFNKSQDKTLEPKELKKIEKKYNKNLDSKK